MKNLIISGIVIVCVVLMYKYPHAMLNPGELTEGHQKLKDDCFSCHNPFWGIPNDKCIACHKPEDIDKSSRKLGESVPARKKIIFHQFIANHECVLCHTDHNGLKPEMSLDKFNHSVLPANMSINCGSCHDHPQDNLHKQLTNDCNSCHSIKGWKSSVIFKHDLIQGDQRNNCSSCHKSPDDSFHLQTKDNCNKCHSVDKWKPSTFDHSAYFELDKNHNDKCNTCHANSDFKSYTCYGCHEHSESKLMKKHNEHGISDFSNCVTCHRSGDEHDIRMNGTPDQKSKEKEPSFEKKNNGKQEKDKKEKHEDKRKHDDDD